MVKFWRVWVARVLVPFVLVGFYPQRQAYAFAPPVTPLALSAMTSSGSLIPLAGIAAVGVALGALATGYLVGYVVSKVGDPQGNSITVPATSTSTVPVPVVPATSTPPGTRYNCNYSLTNIGTCTNQESFQAACEQFIGIMNASMAAAGTDPNYGIDFSQPGFCHYGYNE